jgi:hypothetical protein
MGVEQQVVRTTTYDVPDVLSRLVELDAKPQIGDGWLTVLERSRAREIRYNHDNTPHGIAFALFDALTGFGAPDGYNVLDMGDSVIVFIAASLGNDLSAHSVARAFDNFYASMDGGGLVPFGSGIIDVRWIERLRKEGGRAGFRFMANKVKGVTGYGLDGFPNRVTFSRNGGEAPKDGPR